MWPWDTIYYKRLKKRPIFIENYARRIAQNRGFGIVDEYIRSSYGLYQSSVQILETESERESDASNAWSCNRAMDHKVLLSLVPIHTVILPSQLPTEFLEPSLEKKWVVGFDCEDVDPCHHGIQFIHGANPSVKSKALSYDLITYMQLLDNEPVETQRSWEMTTYYKRCMSLQMDIG